MSHCMKSPPGCQERGFLRATTNRKKLCILPTDGAGCTWSAHAHGKRSPQAAVLNVQEALDDSVQNVEERQPDQQIAQVAVDR